MAALAVPWVEKYRPETLGDVVAHQDIIQTICNLIERDTIPHLLLHGPPGTGKTSTIHAIAKKLYGPMNRSMVLELNASDDRGINVVRETVKSFAESGTTISHTVSPDGRMMTLNSPHLIEPSSLSTTARVASAAMGASPPLPDGGTLSQSQSQPSSSSSQSPHPAHKVGGVDEDIDMEEPGTTGGQTAEAVRRTFTRVKLVVLDEADQMTAQAQMALRRIMEKYCEHVRFCIICNYVNKINPALQSRCTKFRFPPLPAADMKAKALDIARKEGIQLTTDGCDTLTRLSGGDMRRVINVMQAAAMSSVGAELSGSVVLNCVGLPLPEEMDTLFNSLCESKFSTCYDIIMNMQNSRGYSLTDINTAIYKKAVTVAWPQLAALVLFPRLADIEYRLSHGADETIQAAALVSAFVEIRAELEKVKFVLNAKAEEEVK